MNPHRHSPATKRRLAALLSLLMVAAFGHTAFWLHGEGAKLCAALASEASIYGGGRPPCVRTVSAPASPTSSRVQQRYLYTWSARAQLREVVIRGEDVSGEPLARYDCSPAGKLLLPLVALDAWAFVTAAPPGEAAAGEASAGRGRVEHSAYAVALADGRPGRAEVERRFLTDAAGPYVTHTRHLDADERVVSRSLVDSGLFERHWRYVYDARGNLVRQVQRTHLHDAVTTSVIDYDYSCWADTPP